MESPTEVGSPVRPVSISIVSETAKIKNTVFITGHSNKGQQGNKARTKVTLHSDAVRVEDNINLDHMLTLGKMWNDLNNTMDRKTFGHALWKTIGSKLGSQFQEHTSFLFKKMDTNHDQMVDWNEFCTYMMIRLQEKDELEKERDTPLLMCHDMAPECHKTRIVRIQGLMHPPRFMSASEDGLVVMYNMKMRPTQKNFLDAQNFIPYNNTRCTDALLMPNANRFVLATSSRELRFYEVSTGARMNTINLTDSASCIDYYLNPEAPASGHLVFGDTRGKVGHIFFSNAAQKLFDRKMGNDQEGIRITSLPTLNDGDETDRANAATATADVFYAHPEGSGEELEQCVKDVHYAKDIDSIISCCADPKSALVVTDLSKGTVKGDSRCFKIPKGCQCFNYSAELKLIATGGRDGHIRVWNPYIRSQPVSMYIGHKTCVSRVAFNPAYKQLVSVSSAEIIKIWDLQEMTCLNTLDQVIPQNVHFVGQEPLTAFLWHEPSKTMLTTAGRDIVILQLLRDDNASASRQAHDLPVTCCVCIKQYDALCTGDAGGSIVSWEIQTGTKILAFADAHPGASVSCLAAGADGKRLLSGASNGELFVWNVMSGTVLQKLTKEDPREVTGIVSLPGCIFTIGWDGRLVRFLDDKTVDISKAPIYVPQDHRFHPVDYHSDDVTSIDACGESLLASGSFDGHIIIWNLKYEMASKRFDTTTYREAWARKQHASAKAKHSRLLRTVTLDHGAGTAVEGLLRGDSDDTAQVAEMHFPKVSSLARKAVDALLWLKERVKSVVADAGDAKPAKNIATLVASCDGGCLAFWNALKGDLLGAFHAVGNEIGQDSVTSIAASADNTLLYTGDSLGTIRVWDIAYYCIDGFDSDPPRLVQEWVAHVQGISAVQLVESSGVLITCSSDCAVRVWGAQSGTFIGSFGDTSQKWSLSMRGDRCESPSSRMQTQKDMDALSALEQRRLTLVAADDLADMISHRTHKIQSSLAPGGLPSELHAEAEDSSDAKAVSSPATSSLEDVGGPGHVSDDESDWEDVDGHGSTSLHSVENSPSRMSPSRNPTTTTNATTPAEFAKVEQEVRVDDTDGVSTGGIVPRRGSVILPPIARTKGSAVMDSSVSFDCSAELDMVRHASSKRKSSAKIQEARGEWDAQTTVLGKTYSRNARVRHAQKMDWMHGLNHPATEKSTIKHLRLLCTAFNGLKVGQLSKIPSTRVPSAVRRKQLAIPPISARGGKKPEGGGGKSPKRSRRSKRGGSTVTTQMPASELSSLSAVRS